MNAVLVLLELFHLHVTDATDANANAKRERETKAMKVLFAL